jgi:hypothetical protein
MVTTDLLTQVEVTELTGVSRACVRLAQREGRLPGTELETSPSGRVRWGFKRADVATWRATLNSNKAGTKRARWTDDQREAVIELRATCTAAQAAAYLGRSEHAVNVMWAKMGAAQTNPIAPGPRTPFNLPRNAILLAKTCTHCGKLRDARFYGQLADCLSPICALCMRGRVKRHHDINGDGPYARNVQLIQDITLEQAFNERKRYTSGERAILADRAITEVEAAFKLNRSYLAVYTQRRTMGMYPKRPRTNLPDSHWVIDFPNAAKALQDHFRSLGKAVPEQLWDWNNTMEGEM